LSAVQSHRIRGSNELQWAGTPRQIEGEAEEKRRGGGGFLKQSGAIKLKRHLCPPDQENESGLEQRLKQPQNREGGGEFEMGRQCKTNHTWIGEGGRTARGINRGPYEWQQAGHGETTLLLSHGEKLVKRYAVQMGSRLEVKCGKKNTKIDNNAWRWLLGRPPMGPAVGTCMGSSQSFFLGPRG